MAYKIKRPKMKKKTVQHRNPYYVDGKDVSKLPIYLLEEGEDSGLTPKQFQALWQYGVDSGIVWKLQGWYGRNAMALLESGYIKHPKKRTYDYYGNPIPTRDEIKSKKVEKI
jgi:hypothetical protein